MPLQLNWMEWMGIAGWAHKRMTPSQATHWMWRHSFESPARRGSWWAYILVGHVRTKRKCPEWISSVTELRMGSVTAAFSHPVVWAPLLLLVTIRRRRMQTTRMRHFWRQVVWSEESLLSFCFSFYSPTPDDNPLCKNSHPHVLSTTRHIQRIVVP